MQSLIVGSIEATDTSPAAVNSFELTLLEILMTYLPIWKWKMACSLSLAHRFLLNTHPIILVLIMPEGRRRHARSTGEVPQLEALNTEFVIWMFRFRESIGFGRNLSDDLCSSSKNSANILKGLEGLILKMNSQIKIIKLITTWKIFNTRFSV